MIGPAYLGRTSAGLIKRQMPSTCNEQILVREFGVQSIGEQHQNPGSEAQALRAHNPQAHSLFFFFFFFFFFFASGGVLLNVG